MQKLKGGHLGWRAAIFGGVRSTIKLKSDVVVDSRCQIGASIPYFKLLISCRLLAARQTR